MKNYKIYKVYHDKDLLKTFPCQEDRIYYDTSESKWGKYFCEGLIFFDDKLDINCDYIGLEHYCRSFTNLNPSTADEYLSKVNNNFCWLWFHFEKDYYGEKVGYFSSEIFKWKQLDTILFKYLKKNKLYKELSVAALPYLVIHRTMFIMQTEQFLKMKEFVRNVTYYFIKELKIKEPQDIENLTQCWKPELSIFRGTHRLFAFIIEHLVSVWITANINNRKDFPAIQKNGYKEFRYDQTNLDIHLVDHCNLNCAYCSHLAPFADKKFLQVEKFEKDLNSIPKFVLNKFKYIYLLGGEPLLHPQACDIINIARKYFPNKDIRFLTNGLLLQKMGENFWNTLKENNIFLDITQYPINFDYSFVEEIPDKYGVNVLTHQVTDTTNFFSRQQLDPDGLQDYEYQYKHCLNNHSKNCFQLDGTLLRVCPTEKYSIFLNKFQGINIRNFEEDQLDLSKVTDIQELENWYYTPKKFCSQCVNDKWRPMKYKISERKLEEYV